MENWVDPTRIAIVLPRVSTAYQVGNYSWKAQLDLEALARKDGFVEVEVMEEAGVSGEDLEKRPVLQQVLQKIETGRVGALYLMNWSRGSRDEDLTDGRKIVQVCRKHHTIIRMPESAYDFDREDDENFADIGFLIGKWQKRAIIKAMSRGQYKKAGEGKFVGQRPRFGYKYDQTLIDTPRGKKMNTDWEIDEKEAEVLKFLHHHFPRFSTRKWAAVFNRLAKWGKVMYYPIKSKKDQERMGRTEREWEQYDIRNIIRNEMTIGRISYATYRSKGYVNGHRQPSRHLKGLQPIYKHREDLRLIDDETFERNNRILAERGKAPIVLAVSKRGFSGILRCPLCGGTMCGHGRKKLGYICSEHQRKGSPVCKGFTVHETSVKEILFPTVVELLQTNIRPAIERLQQKHVTDEQSQQTADLLRCDIVRLEQEIQNLLKYARAGAITPEQLKDENSKLLEEKAKKQSRLDKLEHPDSRNPMTGKGVQLFTQQFMDDLPDYMEYLYTHRVSLFNQIIKLIFQNVVITSDHRGKGWKKGLSVPNAAERMNGRKYHRPCYVSTYVFHPGFEQWKEESGLKLPFALETAQGYNVTSWEQEQLARRSLRITRGNQEFLT